METPVAFLILGRISLERGDLGFQGGDLSQKLLDPLAKKGRELVVLEEVIPGLVALVDPHDLRDDGQDFPQTLGY